MFVASRLRGVLVNFCQFLSWNMKIIYKYIRNGYARIDKDGELLITIPLSKKWKEFEKIMIQKWEKLLKRYSKRTQITPIQKDSILLFGEEVPMEDIKKHYPKHFSNSKFKISNLPADRQGSKLLKSILEEYASPIVQTYSEKLGISCQKLSFRKTISKRWSCTHDQKISLNLDLVHLPSKYIKYVIIHECCHLKQKNHSKKFRALVESFCPNYKETKKQLRKFVIK